MDSRCLESQDFDVFHQMLTIQHINVKLLLELEAHLEQKMRVFTVFNNVLGMPEK